MSSQKKRFVNKVTNIESTKTLDKFLTSQGKILPRRVSNLNSQSQKRIAANIKLARVLALKPYVCREN